MTFLIRSGASFHGTAARARALDAWRSAADLVWARWELLGEASPECRAAAFVDYNAALDAEADAADVLADIQLSNAA
ncbi:MAG TPA: hypothetical protein VKG82_04660 [Solirubrobacteraceae bacterium]|nr:hypothetical protein [Solirubrobacteraceae bacterium]HME03037.1 hypothetical protein [Solirubrobacteraceae bacterium]